MITFNSLTEISLGRGPGRLETILYHILVKQIPSFRYPGMANASLGDLETNRRSLFLLLDPPKRPSSIFIMAAFAATLTCFSTLDTLAAKMDRLGG